MKKSSNLSVGRKLSFVRFFLDEVCKWWEPSERKKRLGHAIVYRSERAGRPGLAFDVYDVVAHPVADESKVFDHLPTLIRELRFALLCWHFHGWGSSKHKTWLSIKHIVVNKDWIESRKFKIKFKLKSELKFILDFEFHFILSMWK